MLDVPADRKYRNAFSDYALMDCSWDGKPVDFKTLIETHKGYL